MHSWMERRSGLVTRQNRAKWQSSGQRLRDGYDVGCNSVVLVGEVLPSPAESALDFIKDQQPSVRRAKFTSRGQELRRDRLHTALPLNRLEPDRHDRIIEL